jgi:tripartite-type tricarboxylate transporter receptor subunit TctC
VAAAVAKPEIQKMFTQRNIEGRSTTPEEMEVLIKEEMAQWGDVIKRANIRME